MGGKTVLMDPMSSTVVSPILALVVAPISSLLPGLRVLDLGNGSDKETGPGEEGCIMMNRVIGALEHA